MVSGYMDTGKDAYAAQREHLVAEIEAEALVTASYTGRATLERRVLDTVGRVPRHEFVPVELQPYAYLNRPLPIGFDKTVSQPYIVALMTDLLDLAPTDVVLEIGTGAGYQAAILAGLAQHVYTVEIIDELAAGAQSRLRRLGYANIDVKVGNGYYGWAEHGPYDKIMVTAACDLVPAPLLSQLAPGGRMIAPTGIPEKQSLTLVEKTAAGALSARDLLPVRFSELEDPDPFAGAA
ncbi:MAG TPA: protein-L-isoaspartate(D-aspartate) O-methyltransferase [Burkholderiales bacterium]|nr:protein-L-isoaspartate(D-aspartate) O-methyltransferase [Burkholderiales bacterium]